MTPKILLIGCGRWGINHLRVWLRLQAEGLCELVGVQDSSPLRLSEIAREFKVRTFSDSRGLPEADAVDIAVPAYSHYSVARQALIAGKDVLVEKPVTETPAQARELQRISKRLGRVLMVGHLFHYNPATERVKKLIVDKDLGAIRFLRGRFMGFRFPEHDAGVLATTAIHFIYLANYFIGKKPRSVWAHTAHMLGTERDDLALIRLDYGPEFALIESEYFTPGKWRTFDIIGTQGSAYADLLKQTVDVHRTRHAHVGTRIEAHDAGIVSYRPDFAEPLDIELRDFLHAIAARGPATTGIEEGLETVKIIKAAYQSARTGRTIALK